VKVALAHEEIFGKAITSSSFMDHGIPSRKQRDGVRRVSELTKIPMVVTTTFITCTAEDAEART